ncbi:DUF3093 domain-containing protein [Spongisporangium articulatum]|uniref:DUF3093 domain-containing protein n=1 Tax=Spongisporangium articulatum TaxID=3362603 RepID=A0ABW8AS68_9ACTN
MAESTAVYRERLLPSPWAWSVLAGFGAALGLVVGPIAPTLAIVVAVVGCVALITVGWLLGTVVEIADGRFRAGRASIPVEFVSAVEPLEGDDMRHAAGPGLDARAYLCLRGWVKDGVRVRIDDPADPTPYWLVSTRSPRRLTEALSSAAPVSRPTSP